MVLNNQNRVVIRDLPDEQQDPHGDIIARDIPLSARDPRGHETADAEPHSLA
jgi:hypothetical protein